MPNLPPATVSKSIFQLVPGAKSFGDVRASLSAMARTRQNASLVDILTTLQQAIDQLQQAIRESNPTVPQLVANEVSIGDLYAAAIIVDTLVVGGSTVLSGAPDTGWAAITGTATKGGGDTSTLTTTQLAETVKALVDALTAQGLLAP